MELEERVYDAVDVTQGVSERSYVNATSENRPPQPSGYKSLQKQNEYSVYTGISQSEMAVDVIATNGAKDKGKIVKMVLLFLCVLFLFLLSLGALSTAVASIVKLTNDLAEYRDELDRLTNSFNEHVRNDNLTNIIIIH